jgi:hypothetical protein
LLACLAGLVSSNPLHSTSQPTVTFSQLRDDKYARRITQARQSLKGKGNIANVTSPPDKNNVTQRQSERTQRHSDTELGQFCISTDKPLSDIPDSVLDPSAVSLEKK